MKKTYIIPAVKTYKVRAHNMIALSLQGAAGDDDGGVLTNENAFDDQESKPWYK